MKEETLEDSETAIMDAKYGFIHGALEEASYSTGKNEDTYQVTHLLDLLMTNKFAGFPVFILILGVMFFTTFTLGAYPMDWIERLVAWLSETVGQFLPDGPVKAMLIDGVLGV